MPPSSRTAAVAGFAAGAAGLGVAELLSGLLDRFVSPVVALADTVVRYLPTGVKQPAVELLGTGDKPALLATIVVVTLGLVAWLATVALRDRRMALAGVGVLTVLAVLATVDAPRHGLLAAVPSLAAGGVAAATLAWLLDRVSPDATGARGRTTSRRGMLEAAAGLTAAGALLALVGRRLAQRTVSTAARLSLAIPSPSERRDLPVPTAAHPAVDGLPPAVTPNSDFYRIDTAFTVPRIDPSTHVVRVTGLVDRELEIPFPELLERPQIELPIMLACVSNEVGGDLVDTAIWQGVLLRDLLEEAGVSDRADQIVGRAVDGWTCGFPVPAAFDRPTMLAVTMNGEPLPAEHGFPVRLVTPGLYGYVSATKWLAEIELTRFDEFDQYWVRRGWAEQAPIKTQSRIDVPAPDATIPSGTQPVAGVAWAPLGGVSRVEVRVDDHPWEQAELALPINDLSWRQWVYRWDTEPGRHFLSVRATEAGGETQTGDRLPPKPNGATGWHMIQVTVGEEPEAAPG